MSSIRLNAGASALAAGLVLAGAGAPAPPASSSAPAPPALSSGPASPALSSGPALPAASSRSSHGRSSKKTAQPAIPREGFWKLAAGASQQIFLNQGKAAVQVVAFVCVDPRPGGRPMVHVSMAGRPPVEAPAGCQNVYLQVDSGDWVALINPGPDGASGSYKVAQQG